jgi:hemolysin III
MLGIVFYAWKKLPYNHAIWHLFVLGGSTCHYLAILFYLLPHA